ncbi:MAG: alpha/beta hydrolase [Spirochaetales bacterium]|nr:alpha/beta hydrolase [Spirochaetales bacterium]
MKKNHLLIIALAALLFAGCATAGSAEKSAESDVYLTYELRDTVTMEPVFYKNRYGITLAGHMFLPADMDRTKQYPAVIIGTPYGGVKEQGAGIYGMNMAERGFVAIAFDASFNGESGGDPSDVSSPDFFVEDFSAGVDYLGSLRFVDRDKIAAIGICGSGGFSLTAAQVDKRIKAVVTASMYDISSMARYGFGYYIDDVLRDQMLEQLSLQRWEDFESGSPALPQGGWPVDGPAEVLPEGLPPVMDEFFEYYGMKRGWHPNTIPNFTLTSTMAFMNFPLMQYLDEISPRPILFIMGENAHSRYYTEDAYEAAAEPKELMIIPGARHIDLYDRENMIPFDRIESFLMENL